MSRMTPRTPTSERDGDRVFVRRFLIELLLVALALLVYRLADVFLLIFGATLVAVILRAIANPIARLTGLPSKFGLSLAVLLVLGLLAVTGWLLGAQVTAQVGQLRDTLPAVWHSFETRIGDMAFGERILAAIKEAVPSVASDLGRRASALPPRRPQALSAGASG